MDRGISPRGSAIDLLCGMASQALCILLRLRTFTSLFRQFLSKRTRITRLAGFQTILGSKTLLGMNTMQDQFWKTPCCLRTRGTAPPIPPPPHGGAGDLGAGH